MRASRTASVLIALAVGVMTVAVATPAAAAPPVVGQGFTVTPGDLAFILKQIKIAERHSNVLQGKDTELPAIPPNPNPATDPDYCQALVGPGPDRVPDILTSYGLRTVDGSCNNLKPPVPDPNLGLPNKFAAADQPFPRLTTPTFSTAEPITPSFPVGPTGPTSYQQKTGSVVDSQPRVISNLIDDQTSANPAAVAAAKFPIRSQRNPGVVPCATVPGSNPPVDISPATPAGCVPGHQTLFIPNVTTDAGLSPPYNSLFTFFGQFFDHGVDQTVKGGGTVFVPLRADDPLIAGSDHVLGTKDDLPPAQRFMVLTRAQNQPGPDGVLGTADDVQNAANTDTPWVDNSQTYGSHASHQVFLREYALNAAGHPVSTGKLLGGLPAGQTYANSPDGTSGIGTWAAVKQQAATKLGFKLVDADVTNIPMLATDPYGKFIPGPARGLPQYVTTSGLVEGNLANPVPVPATAAHFDTPFITDIAHNADPSPQDTDNNPATPPVAPVPDGDSTPSADFAHQPAGTYDNEMLDAHFVCGDGRCNENIALSAIHQVFHTEHNRLIDDIKNVLSSDASADGVAVLPQWKLPTTESPDGWNGERLFQAARFVNEMEYQHTVFEEFARKVQPAIRVFHAYSPDINPAIKAEFAHAVYRFGHSMLDDTVARTNVDPSTGAKTDNSLPLLTAFLNPPAYFDGGTAGSLTPERAAGSIIMGSSDQVGNELDEFMTETLRSNLLGLPLDLATLNLARAREAGIPPLNDVRRQLFGQTNDGALAPYTSWTAFGQHLKHPESLINFVAGYGTHPTIRDSGPDGVLGTADDVTTVAAKRAAARAIVNPIAADPAASPPVQGDVPPTDATDFMQGTGAWATPAGGVTSTGLDGVDLWVGGLAEKTSLFGGLLGSTFNYVFQSQLENLQDGDRLYYLARTPGLNLLSQLEGNSFGEMIQRTTQGTNSLKADAFATADCKFQLANLDGTPAGYATHGATVADDPTTPCDESKLLQRMPDGTIQYLSTNSVNPSGINFQSVYNGTTGADRVYGGSDNDTFWGGTGNDVIDGGAGNDVVLGGEGNDIITDADGADLLKGGPGNDAVDGGPGNDLVLGGDGQDFLNGGAGDNETFGGPGNDFIIGGLGADTVFGDGGDDWIQGGAGQDLLNGDHGAPFLDDPGESQPGNDILIGQAGGTDYNAEGGDDVMLQNAGIDRNAGAGGFDWATNQGNTIPAVDDMMINNNQGGLPIQVTANRDRWQETEADSGWNFDDVIKGTDGVLATPRLIGGAGFVGCDALDQAGVARVQGLADLLPPVSAWPGQAADVAAASASGRCPLTGPVWGEGDILLGGAGNDTLTGRAGNDIIDGDAALQVRISVRTNPADPATEIGSTDLMEHQYLHTGSALLPSGELDTTNLTGPTLQQAVFAGTVDPGNLVAVREIVHPAGGTSVDTAEYLGPRSSYTITAGTKPGQLIVTQSGPVVAPQTGSDGIDTLTNIEQLKFADGTVAVAAPGVPTITSATAGVGSATVVFAMPKTGGLDPTSFTIRAVPTVGPGAPVTSTIAAVGSVGTITGLTNGTTYTLQVAATNVIGTSAYSGPSAPVTPIYRPPTTPGAPVIGTVTPGDASATVTWTAPSDGGSPITGFYVQPFLAGVASGSARFVPGSGTTSFTVTGLTNGKAYTFKVQAVNSVGSGAYSAASSAVTPAAPPGAPVIGKATSSNRTATIKWNPPKATGGLPITGYVVTALMVDAAGNLLASSALPIQPAAARSFKMTLVPGLYTFTVQAVNAAGPGPASARSNIVTVR
jgi:Ca2+-binding RTX toxin-like protein